MLKNLFGLSKEEDSSNKGNRARLTADGDGIFEELASIVNSSGRVSFSYLVDVARSVDREGFERYLGGPVLAGSGIHLGTLEQPPKDETGKARGRARTLLFRRAELLAELKSKIDSEPLTQAVYPLRIGSNPPTPHVLTIGREPGNDIVVPDFAISRVHAEIRIAGKRFEIMDCGSSNGTMVNGAAVSAVPITLGFGDLISFARYEFSFLHPDAVHSMIAKLKRR